MKTRQIVAVFLIILCCLSWSVSSIAVSYDPIVEQVQKRLTELGYDPGPVDGKMGRKTTAAIREFQQDRSLLATGELNEATILKLGLSLQTEKPDTEKISKKDQEPTLTNVIDTFEREILSYIQNNEIRKAFIATAEYEHELISKYDPPTFQNDLFQSEADHLSFHSFFTSWKQAELEELEIPMFNILFALEGEVEEDRFILLSMGIGQIQQRMGISESYKTGLSDRELLFGATMIASELGSIRNQEFKSIGEHQVLVLEIETPMGGPSVMMVSLGHGKQLYAFILSSSLRNRAENRKHLVELIKTVKFNYKPADESKIKAIREKFLGQDEPEPILQSVAQLALSGEYNATTEELARLRTLLSKLMPKPFIKENVAYYPAYGITLANPDEEKWKLSFEESGIIKAILLEDKWSTKQEGIGIFILDLILSYGPQATKIVGDKEEERKQALINLGRGSALYGGGPIESERLTTIKNNLAYEAIVATNMPGLKAKCFSILRSGSVIGILMFVDANNFQEKIEEYEQIIQGDWLKIGSTPGPTSTPTPRPTSTPTLTPTPRDTQPASVEGDFGEALINAAKNGELLQVQALLNQGADVNAKDNTDKTALMWAALKGYTDIIKVLLDRGASVQVKTRVGGKTALQYATDKGHTEIIRLLRKAGARE